MANNVRRQHSWNRPLLCSSRGKGPRDRSRAHPTRARIRSWPIYSCRNRHNNHWDDINIVLSSESSASSDTSAKRSPQCIFGHRGHSDQPTVREMPLPDCLHRRLIASHPSHCVHPSSRSVTGRHQDRWRMVATRHRSRGSPLRPSPEWGTFSRAFRIPARTLA